MRPHEAIIAGNATAFNDIEAKFDALVAEWRALHGAGSSTSPLVNDAYGQIVAMGWDAVPLLLREVERQSGHWFTALMWITGHDPVTPEIRGNIREIRKVWVQWGKDNGYASGQRDGRLVAGQSANREGTGLPVHK